MLQSQQIQYAVSVFNEDYNRYDCILVTQFEDVFEYEIERLRKGGHVVSCNTVYETELIKRNIVKLKKINNN